MSKTQSTLVNVTAEGTGTLTVDLLAHDAKDFTAYIDVTAGSGTTPTLDVKFQEQDPASGNWIDIPSAAFTQATGVTSERITFSSNVRELRCSRTVGGTTPSFDYTVGIAGAP